MELLNKFCNSILFEWVRNPHNCSDVGLVFMYLEVILFSFGIAYIITRKGRK